MDKILITGGLGFIGSNLGKRLLERNNEIWIVDDYSNSKLDPKTHFNVETRTLMPALSNDYDIKTDPKTPRLIFLECDCNHSSIITRIESGYFTKVFHLAAKPRVEWTVQNPIKSTDENFNKSIKLAFAASIGKTKFIFASTAAVYGDATVFPTNEEWNVADPTSPYGLSKWCVERYLSVFENLYGLDWIVLRYFNVYGPGQDGDNPYATAVSAWCDKALKGEPLRSDGDGNQTRDMIHVHDVADANVFISNYNSEELKHRIFNVGSGSSVSNNFILKLFSERGYKNTISAPERPGDVKHTLADIRRLEKIGWEPKISFELGLKNVFEYWGL